MKWFHVKVVFESDELDSKGNPKETTETLLVEGDLPEGVIQTTRLTLLDDGMIGSFRITEVKETKYYDVIGAATIPVKDITESRKEKVALGVNQNTEGGLLEGL